MQILEYSYYYVVHISEMMEDYSRIKIDPNITVVLTNQDTSIHEIYFDKDAYPSERDVKRYWTEHSIRVIDKKTENSIKIGGNVFLEVKEREPLPLLQFFIEKSSNDPEEMKKLLSQLYQHSFPDEEYLELYDYFEEYYRNDHSFMANLYDRYEVLPDHLKFLDLLEDKAFYSEYSQKYKHCSFELKQQINALYAYVMEENACLYVMYDDGDMRMLTKKDKLAYALIIKLAIIGGNMLIHIKGEAFDTFEMVYRGEKSLKTGTAEECQDIAQSWMGMIIHNPAVEFHQVKIILS